MADALSHRKRRPILRNMRNDTQPTAPEIVELIAKLERYIDTLEIIPATHQCRSAVMLALLSKALTVGRAICLLVESEFPAEAFAMSRTLMEIFFCVRYMGNKDTESRAETYAKYHTRVRQEWHTIIMKYYPHIPVSSIALNTEVLETAKGFKHKAYWTGHGGQAKLMALEEDAIDLDEHGKPAKSDFDYDVLYFWTSHFVHATVWGIEGHCAESGEIFRVRSRSWVDEGRGEDALFNTVVFLLKIFVCTLRAINEEQPDVLQDLYNVISRFGDRKAI